ncbi:MAG: hypothetical protein WC107_02685 [Patescibacteria group bacterium]
MRKLLAVLTVVLLLTIAVSTGAYAEGFLLLPLTFTHSEKEAKAAIFVEANKYDPSGKPQGWTDAEKKMLSPVFGSTLELRFTAALKTVTENKSHKVKRPVSTEWYSPRSTTSGVPYDYSDNAKARAENEALRLRPSDPTDACSPVKLMLYPAQVLNRNTYTPGINNKSMWLRVVNGLYIVDQLKMIFKITQVSGNDIWVQVVCQFVATCDEIYPVDTGNAGKKTATQDVIDDIFCRLDELDEIDTDHADQITAVKNDICTLAAQIGIITDDIAELKRKLNEYAAEANKPRPPIVVYGGHQGQPGPITHQTRRVRFTIAFVDYISAKMPVDSKGRYVAGSLEELRRYGCRLTATTMECISGNEWIGDGLARYHDTPIEEGVQMFSILAAKDDWREKTIFVDFGLENRYLVVPVKGREYEVR